MIFIKLKRLANMFCVWLSCVEHFELLKTNIFSTFYAIFAFKIIASIILVADCWNMQTDDSVSSMIQTSAHATSSLQWNALCCPLQSTWVNADLQRNSNTIARTCNADLSRNQLLWERVLMPSHPMDYWNWSLRSVCELPKLRTFFCNFADREIYFCCNLFVS